MKYSAHFVTYFFFYLLTNPMYRRDFGRFSRKDGSDSASRVKAGEQVSIIFSIQIFFYEVLDIFPRLSYRLTFIMLNVGMVDNLEFW